jgi:hypothetical protein
VLITVNTRVVCDNITNNRQYMLSEYANLHIGQKTMVTLVYQMKTNKIPSLLVTNLFVPC